MREWDRSQTNTMSSSPHLAHCDYFISPTSNADEGKVRWKYSDDSDNGTYQYPKNQYKTLILRITDHAKGCTEAEGEHIGQKKLFGQLKLVCFILYQKFDFSLDQVVQVFLKHYKCRF